jgi:hypothetical protein
MKKLLLFLALTLSSTPAIQALSLESPRYKMELNSVQPRSENQPNQVNRLETSLTKAQLNTLMKEGFVVINTSNNRITAHLSDVMISFGTLTPHKAAHATTTVGVTYPSTGFQLEISAEYPLKSFENKVIPQLTCNTCSPLRATTWDSADLAGFGYTASGKDVASDFTPKTYRSLADLSKKNVPAIIATNNTYKQTDSRFSQAQLSFKIQPSFADTYIYDTIVDISVLPHL